jgi:hypothetical protein
MLHLRRSNEQYYSNSQDFSREVFIRRTLVPLSVSTLFFSSDVANPDTYPHICPDIHV